MTHLVRSIARRLWLPAALAAAIFGAPTAPVHAEAVWSADAFVINAANPGAAPALGNIGVITNNTVFNAPFAWAVLLGNGNSYTATGNFSEITTPGPLGSTASSLIVVNNFTITANPGNVGNIADTMWFFSDVFPNTAAGLPGWVGMLGTFVSAPGQVGSAQAEMNFNNVVGNVGSFLTTVPVSNLGAGGITPFAALHMGIIPNQVDELTGLLAFSLAPGQSLTLPFDFSDNVDLTGMVPEPGSILLLTMGILPMGIVAVWRVRRMRAA